MNSLAFVPPAAVPAGTTQTSQDFQNRVLLWKQAPETWYARWVSVTGCRGAQGTSWGVLFPPESLEVGPEHLSATATKLGPSGTKHPQVTFGSPPFLAALRHGPLSVALHGGRGPVVVSSLEPSRMISVLGDR